MPPGVHCRPVVVSPTYKHGYFLHYVYIIHDNNIRGTWEYVASHVISLGEAEFMLPYPDSNTTSGNIENRKCQSSSRILVAGHAVIWSGRPMLKHSFENQAVNLRSASRVTRVNGHR